MSSEGAQAFGIRDGWHAYAGVVVLRGINFEMRSGEVHGLIGENGSGKSTLIKILTGVTKPSGGELYLDGKTVTFSDPKAARRAGVGVVHQDYHLFPNMTVAANALGVSTDVPRRNILRTVDHGAMRQRVEQVIEELGMRISADALVSSLGPAERKFVEIVRAMLGDPRFLILDEPTASLEPAAAQRVLELLDRMRSNGTGLCFVSHRLDEVRKISDRISVLRDGVAVRQIHSSEATEELLVAEMMGDEDHSGEQLRAARSRPSGAEVALRVQDLVLRPGAPPVAFALERGTVLGLTGLLGAGPAGVVHAVSGSQPRSAIIEVFGRRVSIKNPGDATRAGIGFVPEDRKGQGLVLDHSVADNIALASLGSLSRFGFISHADIARRAEHYKESLRIRCRDVSAPVRTLSGGNQQKVLIAKWLASGVQILILEEPTHGVDVKGKGQIHQMLRDFAAAGGSVLVASTDVREVVELCDDVALFRHGAITETLKTADLTGSEVAARGVMEAEHILERMVEGESTIGALS